MTLGMISLTTPELALACEHLGVELPPRPAAEWAELDEESRRLALDVAERCLTDRGLMRDGSPAPDLSAVVAAFTRPTLLIVAQGWRRGAPPGIDSYSISPQLSVAYRRVGGAHLLQAIDPQGLVGALVPEGADEPADSEASPLSVREQTLAGWLAGADDSVSSESPETVRFLETLGDGATYRSVAVAHRPSSGRVAGGELRWIDHPGGRWLVEGEPGSDRLELAPVTAAGLVDELRSFLPEGAGVG